MSVKNLKDLDITNKVLFIRADLNVPVEDGKVTSDARIVATLPTIKYCLEKKAKVLITSHLGRPTEGEYNEAYSLKPVVEYLQNALPGVTVRLEKEYLGKELQVNENEVVVLENVRFNKGEKKNDEELGKAYAALCDVFVMDAFGTAHRAQASTYAVAKYAKEAVAGPLLSAELEALDKVMKAPKRPLVAIVGGSKVSTKLTVLENLLKVADQLIVGGGIANTFLATTGVEMGKSLYEADLIPVAKDILASNDKIPVPVDVRVGKNFTKEEPAVEKLATELTPDEEIMDIGDQSAERLAKIIKEAGTILWNGPVGVFEFPNFREGTRKVAEAIAESEAFSVAGGGDTLAAIDLFGLKDKISYISTGGGAFLEFVEGKKLPAVAILEERSN